MIKPDHPLVHRFFAEFTHRAVVDGVAYFLLRPEHHAKFKPDDIVSFDFSTEKWRPTTHCGPINGRHPASSSNEYDKRRMVPILLANLNGCLVMGISGIPDYGDRSIDLWFSVDIDKGLWTKRYTLQCTPMSPDGEYLSPLMVFNDERLLIWKSWKRAILSYDPRTSQSVDLATVEIWYHSFVMYQGNLLL